MPLSMLLMALINPQDAVPPVPGLCSLPVPANRDQPGCYETNRVELERAPKQIYWQIYEYPAAAAANAEAARHRWAAVTQIHARTWLYVLGGADEKVRGGTKRALIGPLDLPASEVTAHFSEAIFPPGMRTRVHSHPGPEAFYIVEGEQCMETPTDRRKIPAGGNYIVGSGLHIQAAPTGRRNLVLILVPKGETAVIPGGDWKPTQFCG